MEGSYWPVSTYWYKGSYWLVDPYWWKILTNQWALTDGKFVLIIYYFMTKKVLTDEWMVLTDQHSLTDRRDLTDEYVIRRVIKLRLSDTRQGKYYQNIIKHTSYFQH